MTLRYDGSERGITAVLLQSETHLNVVEFHAHPILTCGDGIAQREVLVHFSLLTPGTLWGPHNLLPNAYRFFPSGIKRQPREADHSSPSTKKLRMMELYAHSLRR
jgi:hypothetical protein